MSTDYNQIQHQSKCIKYCVILLLYIAKIKISTRIKKIHNGPNCCSQNAKCVSYVPINKCLSFVFLDSGVENALWISKSFWEATKYYYHGIYELRTPLKRRLKGYFFAPTSSVAYKLSVINLRHHGPHAT